MATSTWKTSKSQAKAPRRQRDWRPEPPTPNSRALPFGNRNTRTILGATAQGHPPLQITRLRCRSRGAERFKPLGLRRLRSRFSKARRRVSASTRLTCRPPLRRQFVFLASPMAPPIALAMPFPSRSRPIATPLRSHRHPSFNAATAPVAEQRGPPAIKRRSKAGRPWLRRRALESRRNKYKRAPTGPRKVNPMKALSGQPCGHAARTWCRATSRRGGRGQCPARQSRSTNLRQWRASSMFARRRRPSGAPERRTRGARTAPERRQSKTRVARMASERRRMGTEELPQPGRKQMERYSMVVHF